jgi:S-methylmethionine-dependent homocysteine/selenocysteine methylase
MLASVGSGKGGHDGAPAGFAVRPGGVTTLVTPPPWRLTARQVTDASPPTRKTEVTRMTANGATPWRKVAQGTPMLLDGGMGQELVARGVDNSTGLWSAQALIDQPRIVQDAHAAFLAAGAELIIANTYASTIRRVPERETFERLNRTAGELARAAVAEADHDALVAGSLPPMFGSYRPDRVRGEDELLPMYRAQCEVQAPYVDLFLCETMSTAGEGRAAAKAAAAFGKPVWVSWTLEDDRSGRLRSGESIPAAAEALADLEVAALLVNCTIPEAATAAMPALAQAAAGRPYGAYANGFQPIDSRVGVNDGADVPGARADLDPAAYADFAEAWRRAGATLIGGCCEVGPDHIAELRRRLAAAPG